MKEEIYGKHCMKSVQIRSFFWSVFSNIQTEYGEKLPQKKTEKTPYFDNFHAVKFVKNVNEKSAVNVLPINLHLAQVSITYAVLVLCENQKPSMMNQEIITRKVKGMRQFLTILTTTWVLMIRSLVLYDSFLAQYICTCNKYLTRIEYVFQSYKTCCLIKNQKNQN